MMRLRSSVTPGERAVRVLDAYPRIAAWALFLTGFAVLLVIDHVLRISDGDVHNGGVPEQLCYGVTAALAIGALVLLWRAVRRRDKWYWSFLEFFAHLILGYIICGFVLLYYIVGTGIDSL